MSQEAARAAIDQARALLRSAELIESRGIRMPFSDRLAFAQVLATLALAEAALDEE